MKNDKIEFTGFPNGPRTWTEKMYRHANKSDIDVSFNETSMEEQSQFKYILSIEGNDVATGLKWQLTSNSVVFMAAPITVSFAMEDLLVPFVHYVPVKDDYSNLVEMVEWARMNDDKCKWISEQATLYMDQLWNSKEAQDEYVAIQRELGERYHKQFGAISDKCEGYKHIFI